MKHILQSSLAVTLLMSSVGAGQDLPLTELDDEQLPSVLREQLEDTERRATLLRRAIELRDEVRELESQIDLAADTADEGRLDALEARLEVQSLRLDETLQQLDLLTQKQGLRHLIFEMRQEDLPELVEHADALLRVHAKRERIITQLFRAYRDGDERRGFSLEEEGELLAHEYEWKREALELRFELFWANEEGDDEAIEELSDALDELGWPEHDEAIERDSDENELQVVPVEVDDQDIAHVSGLSFDQVIVPFMNDYCIECHDASSASGSLDLDLLLGQSPLVINRNDWANVRQQIAVRSMPPLDAEQPSDDQRRQVLAFLQHAIDEFDYAQVRHPGFEPARRLTHNEYNNTVRDLFGLDLKPADRFPADLTATSGFENSANSLFLQPVLMERYLDASEAIVDEAFPLNPTSDSHRTVRRRFLKNRSPREALGWFAERAYRRPLSATERDRLFSRFDQGIESGATGDEMLREMLQVILISPSFLIRSEQNRTSETGKPYRVSDYELASRLSYFLWATMPDEELFRLAAENRLSDSSVLAEQVDRMLADEKSISLGSVFAVQWLGLSNLDRVQRDQIENPWATDSLVSAMKAETTWFFHSLVQENAPVERLIDSDYSFMNEELARHYGVRGIRGDTMQRVSVDGIGRGGVLGHGGILAVTSFPGRTSPVVRGNWILDTLLGTPPPAPPPNVSQFDDRVAENDRLTDRQKLELHRSNPNCYVCHNEIDPLGFALEQYDWFGRYRPTRHGRPVDATGRLPKGSEFEGLTGLRRAIVEQRSEELVEQLVRKMLSYALARQLDYYDEATVQEIIRHLHDNDRRIQTLIHAIVSSDTFQMKQESGE